MPIDRRAFRPVLAALAFAFYAAGAAANPQGGVVKAGSATIAPNGSRLDVIQSSQRAVIDWRSFSIGAGGHVDFKQPSAASATLNRVTGPEMSAILGRLTANGTVFLVNPNGILIGPGAKIDVGGLVAATANLSNENFMAGRYKFDEVVNRNAVIVNRGEITAHAGGLVALVAPGVENSGVIRAELGRVVLASGNRFTLDLFGDKLVTFAVDDKVAAQLTDVDGRPLKAYVNQAGTIETDGGSILIAASAAKAVLDNVINTSGVVRATSFVQRPGEIVLHGGDEGVVRVAGTLDASGRATGASGGSVRVLGAEVVLDAGSRIDVAGDTGGGTALVGGGVQGGGGVPRSSRTAIEGGASVNADALTRGNGGTIVAWSDGETRFAGALSARGGPAGGDGGFVEVSSRREASFGGEVDAAAPAGKGGRLLLDPDFLTVDAATATTVASVLRSGANAELTATDTVDVREPIDGRGGRAGGGLTVNAGNAIAVNNDIVTNDGAVVLDAGAGGIAMNAGPPTSLSGGNGTVIHSGAAPITLTAAGDVTAQYLVTSAAVTVASAGSVRLNRELAGPSGNGIGPLAVIAAQTVELQGVKSKSAGTIPGSVTLETSHAGGTIIVEGPIVAEGNVTIGERALADETTIRLRNDIHTTRANVELNGRTWISPIVRADNLILQDGPPFFSNVDRALFDVPAVQVAVQITGAGSVRFSGDVLWDGSSIPSARYLYNTPQPPGFKRGDQVAVAALRAREPPRPVPYYGLNIRVDNGEVSFGGNVGTFNASGVSVGASPLPGTLGTALTGNGLSVMVTAPLGSLAVSFDGSKSVEATRFLTVFTDPSPYFVEVEGPELFALPPFNFALLPGRGAPLVEVDSGNPNLVGPSPRNVAESSFARAPELPELPLAPPVQIAPGPNPPPPVASGPNPLPLVALDPSPLPLVASDSNRLPAVASDMNPPLPAASGPNPLPAVAGGDVPDRAVATPTKDDAVRRDTFVRGSNDGAPAIQEPLRGADLGRSGGARGAAQDVFGAAAPLVPTDAAAAPASADGEYFSQGAFEFVQTLSRRGSQ